MFVIIFVSIVIGLSLATLIIGVVIEKKEVCYAGLVFTLLSSAVLLVGLIVNHPHMCY